MTDILIIDGNNSFTETLQRDLAHNNLPVDRCDSLSKAMAMLHLGSYKTVLLGDDLPDGDGMDYLSSIREIPSFPEVIILSSNRDPDTAERAIQNGAYHYLTKPPNKHCLLAQINLAMESHIEKSSAAKPAQFKREGIVGSSRRLKSCLNNAARAAASESSILINGETGTGKELFARAIHKNSKRRNKPFIVVDCAALPDTLAENLLFGHERGAYTSADSNSVGLVKQADGGTLFLDEVGELPLSLQKVFLRVLEGRTFRAVGSARETASDFRLLAATNKDLETMVENGQFRRDLLYRLLGSQIQLSSLRDISEDINELACHHIRRYCKRFQLPYRDFSPDFLEVLLQYDWPGNIRELVNTVEQAVTLSRNETTLHSHHLPKSMRARLARQTIGKNTANTSRIETAQTTTSLPDLKTYRNAHTAEIEKDYLIKLVEITDGDVAQGCRISGLSRARYYALMKQHGVSRQA
ncbi:sigma-54 dependent transcriptional regulator [Maridesulfovibrio sp.]|uniref:sigma-54-dependent transcriptional regulator n=1 Tax=Maridesulfovibrio sp. TaxID=2795000 RepID=UPI002A18CBEC|nr:sigma-54 dependent transcriptional regulator [Maridesulfovibrio sp.]